MAEQPIIIKRKIVKGHAHHGGSWKVAYADFVTAMMAFFMVMWLMNMTQADKDKIQGYFNDPLGFTTTSPKSRTLVTMPGMPHPKPTTTPGQGQGDGEDQAASTTEEKTMQQVKKRIENLLSSNPKFQDLAKNVRMTITAEGLMIEFIEAKGAVFFESGSSVIRPEALKLVQSIAPVLAESKHPLQIQGHTDAEPFKGNINGNWALSSERSLSLAEALEKDKVPDHQFTGLSAYAATRLLDAHDPKSYRNRRVTILLPRKYTNPKMLNAPGDALHAALSGASQPEAVILKPDEPNVLAKDKP